MYLSACFGDDESDPFAMSCGAALPAGADAFDESTRQFIDRLPRTGNGESESERVLVGVESSYDEVVERITGVMGLNVVSERDGVTVATCDTDGRSLFIDVLPPSELSDAVRARLDDAGRLHSDWLYLRFRQ